LRKKERERGGGREREVGVRGSRERETLRCMVNGENLFFDSLPFALFSLSLSCLVLPSFLLFSFLSA